jgi:HAD superfamily hydrolase (TIGR01509 family)
MNLDIEAIFLDSGNTMRVIVKDAAFQSHAQQQLVKLIGTQESPDAFYERLEERYAAYKRLAKGTLLQASETELWTRWMLPDHPADQIAPLAGQLTLLWHGRKGRHVPRPDVKETIIELYRRGYSLGIIANSISTVEIPNWLEADSLTQYFKVVVLSSKFGRRKPDLHIYLEAAYLGGIKPVNCAYVADNPSQDIKGARQAGFGMIVILEPTTPEKEPAESIYKPDEIIRQCGDLLKIFPPR